MTPDKKEEAGAEKIPYKVMEVIDLGKKSRKKIKDLKKRRDGGLMREVDDAVYRLADNLDPADKKHLVAVVVVVRKKAKKRSKGKGGGGGGFPLRIPMPF
jgi:hypothetical protein